MKSIYLLTFLLISSTSIACDPVKYLEKGSPAPCTGYLFTPEKEKEVRLKVVELEYEKELNISKSKQIELYKQELQFSDERLKLWNTEALSLNKELVKRQNNDFLKSALFFLLGAAVTTGITYAVNK